MRVRSNLSSATPEKVQVVWKRSQGMSTESTQVGTPCVRACNLGTSLSTRRQRGAWVVPSRHGTIQYSIRLACFFESLRRLFRPIFQAGKADVSWDGRLHVPRELEGLHENQGGTFWDKLFYREKTARVQYNRPRGNADKVKGPAGETRLWHAGRTPKKEN